MTITIKHEFNSPIADDPNAATTQEVQPSHWNADHQITNIDGKSVIGNATNATGNAAEISATAADQILRANSANTGIGWGAVNLSGANATTGILPGAKGGTGSNISGWPDGCIPVAISGSLVQFDQIKFDSILSSFDLNYTGSYTWTDKIGILNISSDSSDIPLVYGEGYYIGYRSLPLLRFYDSNYLLPVFEIGPSGGSISLFDSDQGDILKITAENGQFISTAGIEAQQLTANNVSNGVIPLNVFGTSGQTADLARFVKSPSVVARIDADGRIIAGASSNSSGATLHTAGSFGTRVLSTSTSITAGVGDHTILVNASGAARTITLPTAIGATGRIYVIKKTDSSANAVTVATTSSQTIDGTTTRTLASQYSTITVQSDGANWVRLSQI
jgi:hypothetical protein